METGERIYNLRMQKGLTLEELGNLVGVGKSTVRKWEKGLIANMKRDKIAKLAVALGTTPAYIMCWTSNPDTSDIKGKITPIEPSDLQCKTDDEKNLLLSYRTLSTPSKKKVLSYCNGLADIEKADYELNAAHALPNATTEDKLHDEDIMNDDNF